MNLEKFKGLVGKLPWLLSILGDGGKIDSKSVREEIKYMAVRPWSKLKHEEVPCLFRGSMAPVEFGSIPLFVCVEKEIVYFVHRQSEEPFSYFVITKVKDNDPKSVQKMFDELDEQGGIVDAVVVIKSSKFFAEEEKKPLDIYDVIENLLNVENEKITRKSYEIYFPPRHTQETIGFLCQN